MIDCVAIGFGMNSRLPVRNRLTCPTWRKACFPGTIRLGRSEGLFSLGSGSQSIPQLRMCGTESHRGRTQETGSQWPRATLRREIHAAQEFLDARVGGVNQGENYSLSNFTQRSHLR